MIFYTSYWSGRAGREVIGLSDWNRILILKSLKIGHEMAKIFFFENRDFKNRSPKVKNNIFQNRDFKIAIFDFKIAFFFFKEEK